MLPRSWQPRIRTLVMVCMTTLISFLLSLLLGVSLGFSDIGIQPGFAQSTTDAPLAPASPKAPVVIDGRVLFRLSGIEGFTAETRANSANSELQQALRTKPLNRPIDIRITPYDGLTTLRINNQHLLTVTGSDVMEGVAPQEKAEEWAQLLQAGLDRAQQERSAGYTQSVIWRIVLALIGAIALYSLIRWGRRWLWRRWVRPTKRLSYPRRLSQPILLCSQIGVWLAFLGYVCELLPRARIARYNLFRFLSRTFNNELLEVGETSYSLLNVFKLVLLIMALWLGVRALTTLVKSRFLQAAIPDRGLQDAIATLMQFSLTGLGLFILLQAWGVDLSALAILASVLGVGLGFGLQNIANNFISGWILLIERPVQVGDFINLGDLLGTVERVGARSTEIRTLDRISIIVPNAELVQNRVVNWSHGHPVSQLHLPLGVAYGSTIEQVHRAVMEAAQTHPEVLRYPRPRLRFLGFGESSLDFDLLVWIRDPRHQLDIKSDVYYLLEASLRRHNIEIPFPQRDLNLRSSELRSIVTPQTIGLDKQVVVSKEVADAEPVPKEMPKERVPEMSEQFSEQLAALQQAEGASPNLLSAVMNYSAILQTSKSITENEIERLVTQMRGAQGLAISDRRFRLTVYPKCFVGSEAVTWMVKTQKATREAAVRLGQQLVEQGIIHHVIDEHSFKDENFFYRFYEDEM